MSADIVHLQFGPRIGPDFKFFLSNPSRRYHVRPATMDDLSLPDEPERQPDPDDIIVMEKLVDPDSDCGFSVRHWFYSVQGEVLDTDEDIGKLLQEMRRPFHAGLAEATVPYPNFMGEKMTASLSRHELELLADAIDADALNHDRQPGSCPRDLFDASARAAELRALAERF